MVSVECQSTARASVCTLRQRFLLAMPTALTVLTRVRRMDRDKRSTGPCCLVGHEGRELGPRRIQDAFGEAVMVHHLIDGQIFHGNDSESVDDATALLMREVGASVADALMDPADDLPASPAFRRARDRRRQLALGALQVLCIGAQALRTGCALTCRKGRETPQADINAYGCSCGWQQPRFPFAGYRHKPLPRRRAPKSAGFRRAFQWAMLDNAQGPYLTVQAVTTGITPRRATSERL